MPDYLTPALERWRRDTDVPLLILAIGSLPILLIELVRTDLTPADRMFLDIVVLVAFALDYPEVGGGRAGFMDALWPRHERCRRSPRSWATGRPRC